ncbi:hypothetical protein D3C87_1159050 [compost metagenome]
MHRVGLPAFHVVAADLHMADRLAELRFHLAIGAHGAHGQQGDFVVEVDEAFHDHTAVAHAAAGHGVVPGGLDALGAVDLALALAGAAHHRLDHARVADAAVDGGLEFLERIAELVRAGRQGQRLGGQAADALAVHGQPCGTGGGNHADHAGGFQRLQHRGGDGFDLGHHQIRALGLDQGLQLLAVAHRDGAGMVRHLLARRILVAVHGDGFHAQPLQCDQHFLAELAGAEQHHFGGGGGEGRSEGGHGGAKVWGERVKTAIVYAAGSALQAAQSKTPCQGRAFHRWRIRLTTRLRSA